MHTLVICKILAFTIEMVPFHIDLSEIKRVLFQLESEVLTKYFITSRLK